MTNIQIDNEKKRVLYEQCKRPLLAQLCELHNLSIRDFAAIFEISKSHAEEIVNHKKFPALDLAVRIARYWECTVDDLFAWRIDDDGKRRPLVIEVPGTRQYVRLNTDNRNHESLALIEEMVQAMKEGKDMFTLPRKVNR